MNETNDETTNNEEIERPVESPIKKIPKTPQAMMKAISAMVSGGQITAAQARRFRDDLGISKSTFTKKQSSGGNRKAKRKSAKASRKANR